MLSHKMKSGRTIAASALVVGLFAAACASAGPPVADQPAQTQSTPMQGQSIPMNHANHMQGMPMQGGGGHPMTSEQCQELHAQMMAQMSGEPMNGHQHMMMTEHMASEDMTAMHDQCMQASPEVRAQMQESCSQMSGQPTEAMQHACMMLHQETEQQAPE